jgi:hypothetical protein
VVRNTSPPSGRSSERRSVGLSSDLETQQNVTRIFHGIYSTIID